MFKVNRYKTDPFIPRKTETLFFPNWLKVALGIGAMVAITFTVLAILNYLTPYSAIVAGSVGCAEVIFTAIWYCCKKSQDTLPIEPLYTPPPPFRRVKGGDKKPLSTPTPLGTSRSAPSPLLSPPNWNRMISTLSPHRANLINGTGKIGEYTKAGFHPVPYIGNYDSSYEGFVAPYIQWKLPLKQLAGFPEEMQHIYSPYVESDLLDLYFIGAHDPGGLDSARNLVMHALALPEYEPKISKLPQDIYAYAGGIATDILIRIFEPKGIDPYPIKDDAIPFDCDGVAQRVNYHPGSSEGSIDISPNNARFLIQNDAEYCSFYVGAVFRRRACVFFVVLTRKKENPLSSALLRADNIKDFSTALEGVLYKDNIDKLLIEY